MSTTGIDSNDGLTPSTPKLTIQSVKALFDAASGNKAVYVAPGTYKGGPDWAAASSAYASRRAIKFYMAGVTVDNQDDAAANFANNVRVYAQNLTLEVVGPCTLTNVTNDNVNFGGAYGVGLECTVICRNVTMTAPGASGDCFSAHGDSIGYAYDCTMTTASNKAAIAHIDNSRTYHYRCTVNCGTTSSPNVLVADNSPEVPVAYFEDCVFIADVASAKGIGIGIGFNAGEADFVRCRFIKGAGTWAANDSGAANSPVRMTDCYAEGLNAEANAASRFLRCYGDWKIRMGRGTGTQGPAIIENCVFSRTGAPILEWHFYDGGATWNGGPGGSVRNNIFEDATTAISSVTTAGAIARVNAIWSFENNCFFNNTANYTAGLTADGVDVTGQDPLLVTGSGSDQDNWKVESGSPCIGAGTSGVNIGLGVAA
ncbi:hypothetical protein [Arenimonas alkanexedens]